jgi:uncharacterized membrane protein YphA (DoxX/SURF4 family)
MHTLNVATWCVQIFLGLFFVAAGFPKLLNRGLERWTGFADLPRSLSLLIGISEVLGGLALVLPMATGIAPWLTPLAAIGLAIIVLMASGFHLRAGEYLPALETVLWASIAAVIAISRWHLVAERMTASPHVLVALLAVLVPAVIINLVVLLTRAPKSRTATELAAPAPVL